MKYTANKELQERIKPVDAMSGYVADDKLKNNAVYKVKELLSYEDFLEKYTEFDLNPGISKDRMVWVTVRHYPEGINTERGFVENAIVTSYYDAETGDSIGFSLKSLNKDGNKMERPR